MFSRKPLPAPHDRDLLKMKVKDLLVVEARGIGVYIVGFFVALWPLKVLIDLVDLF